MRWTLAADGQGSPEYCANCRSQRGEDWRCEPCNEPVLWAENLHIAELWAALQTQWRVGFGGPIGLDYTAASTVMTLHNIDNQREALHGLRLMEAEALQVFRARRRSNSNG